MGLARFYHLTQAPLEVTLPKLLQRALQSGLRVEIRVPTPERLVALDEALWVDDPASFLPHGIAGTGQDDVQPVLLTQSETLSPLTTCLISVEGAVVQPEEVAALDRCFLLFDGNQDAAVAHARGQWKVFTAAGTDAEYWSEASGRWEMKATTAKS